MAVDTLPQTAWTAEGRSLLLPGSAIKGILRSHAERIVRTVVRQNAPGTFLEHVDLPLIRFLFGSSGEAKAGGPGPHPGLGALSARDCLLADRRFSAEAWDRVRTARDEGELRAALDHIGLEGTDAAFHVAIDRWTGGAAERLLFSVLEPWGLKWQPLNLTLDLRRIPDGQQKAAIALLLLVLRDLAGGRLTLGHGGNRGLGAIGVDEISFKGSDLAADLEGLAQASLPEGNLEALGRELRADLTEAWETWILDVVA